MLRRRKIKKRISYKKTDFEKPLRSYRKKQFSRMPKVYTKYYFKHEIPSYSYTCYPLRNNTMEAVMINGELIIEKKKILNPAILEHFEIALKITELDDMIFEGVIMVEGDTKGAIMRNLTSKKPSEKLIFVCQDAIECRKYDEHYYRRMMKVPEALPNFRKENTIRVSPNKKKMIWVYEQEMEKLSNKGVIDCKGIIFRPDRKPYVTTSLRPNKEIFFKSEFEG